MARPKIIEGKSRTIGLLISEDVYLRLQKQASERKISLGALIRERLGDGT